LEKNRNIEKEEGWNCAAGNRALSYEGKPNNKQKSKAAAGKIKRGNTRKQDNCFSSYSFVVFFVFYFGNFFVSLSANAVMRHAPLKKIPSTGVTGGFDFSAVMQQSYTDEFCRFSEQQQHSLLKVKMKICIL